MKKWLWLLIALALVAALIPAALWAQNGPGKPPPPPPPMLGISVVPFTPQQAERLGVAYQPGLLVVRVFPGSPTQKAGINRGDVLLSASGSALNSVADLRQALSQAGEAITLKVLRKGEEPKEVTVSLKEGFAPPRPWHWPPPPRFAPHPPSLPLAFLKELQGIPAEERFQHFQGAQFSFTDKEGKPHTLNLVPGEVKEFKDGKLTLLTNSGQETSFTITGETRGPIPNPGKQVIVATLDGGAEARSVMPAGGWRHLPPPRRGG